MGRGVDRQRRVALCDRRERDPLPPPPKTTAPTSSIAAGPDGRLWFTGATALGAITTAGVRSSYPLPASAGGCPSALATKAGERIWFADYCRDRVGSATTAGAVDWYAFAGGGPEAIAFGPDGNLWIGLAKTGQIVRMTPAGTVLDVVSLLYAPQFGGIAPGPDGNMWFTEITSPQVGRIDVPAPAARGGRVRRRRSGCGDVERDRPGAARRAAPQRTRARLEARDRRAHG